MIWYTSKQEVRAAHEILQLLRRVQDSHYVESGPRALNCVVNVWENTSRFVRIL